MLRRIKSVTNPVVLHEGDHVKYETKSAAKMHPGPEYRNGTIRSIPSLDTDRIVVNRERWSEDVEPGYTTMLLSTLRLPDEPEPEPEPLITPAQQALIDCANRINQALELSGGAHFGGNELDELGRFVLETHQRMITVAMEALH